MAYNNIYETLVNRARARNEALIGYIAYSLYKKQKAEFSQSQTVAGLTVTASQKDVFHASFTVSALEGLEYQARELLFGFANAYLEHDIAVREREIIENSVAAKVDKISADVSTLRSGMATEITRATSFSKAFWSGMATNVASLIVTAVIALAWALSSPETMRNFLKVFAP